MEVAPNLEPEASAMGSLVRKRRRERGNDRAGINAPPKVLRKDHASVCSEQSTYEGKSLTSIGLAVGSTFVTPTDAKSVSDPDPLSSEIPTGNVVDEIPTPGTVATRSEKPAICRWFFGSLVLFEVSVFSAEPDEGKHYNIKAYTNKDDPPEEVWREEWHQCYGERYKNDKKEGPVDGISVEVLFLLSTIIVSSTYAVNTNLLFGIARCRLLRENARQLFLDDIYRNPGPLQFDGPGADSRVLSLCVEDLDYMGRIKKLNEYLEKVRAMVKPGCSQDVVKAALSAMSSVTDILSVILTCIDKVINLFESWVSKHGKFYDSLEEKLHRLEIFKDNLKHIDETNKKLSNYWLGLNEFADLSHEEFKNMFLGIKVELPEKREESSEEFTYRDFVDLPKSLDWRKKGAVAPVKNQGSCGSCWAFSTVAAVEGVNQIVTGNLTELSEQELIDCDTSFNNGCNGGLLDSQLQIIPIDASGRDSFLQRRKSRDDLFSLITHA
ncbi:cysteine protease XCP1-like protein [Tanacetum coccineum]